MKNIFELEIVQNIHQANHLYNLQSYPEALNQANIALNVFHQNVAYNQAIAKNYECIIYSLKGLVFMKMDQISDSFQNFDRALLVCPEHSVTLLRRSQLNIKCQNLPNAIQDLGRASLQQIENSEFQSLKIKLRNKIEEVSDESQRNRLLTNFRETFEPLTYNAQIDLDEDSRLSFSTLKQIDKASGKPYQRKPKKMNSFFMEIQTHSPEIQKQLGSPSLGHRYSQVMPPVIIGKFKNKREKSQSGSTSSRFSNIQRNSADINRENSSLNEKVHHKKENRSSKISFSNIQDPQHQSDQPSNTPKKRRSCMKSCRSSVQWNQQIDTSNKTSFQNLKIIDRASSRQNSKAHIQEDDFDRSFDSETNEHNIFTQQEHESMALKCLNNLIEQKSQKSGGKLRRSILKRSSVTSKKSVSFTSGTETQLC